MGTCLHVWARVGTSTGRRVCEQQRGQRGSTPWTNNRANERINATSIPQPVPPSPTVQSPQP